MPKVTINDQEIEVQQGATVMQACKLAGVEIPHFCYHEKLKIAGNCRMCLVEVEKSPKPVASCAMPATEGMVVHTNSPMVENARKGVMEFLLINHPLDCPVCDQGGECDLQDQAFKYGKRSSRYQEEKRIVEEKNLGPLIETHMTRCIHCTRCIRFASDVAGIPEMGASGRGEHMEITTYLEQALTSELSGNLIDLCPVGALNSKPYAFTARSWELTHTESVDIMDAMGCNIIIDSRGQEVMRIRPKRNDDINEEWIADKTRFSYDGLKVQRLDTPYIRRDGKLKPASWQEALSVINKQITGSVNSTQIASIIGASASCEAMFALQKLFGLLGSQMLDANQFGYKIDTSARGNYLFNTGIANIAEADLCLLIGARPRTVAPVLNARIGQSVRNGNLSVYGIASGVDQTYPIRDLGDDFSLLQDIANGKLLASELSKAKKPILIIGDIALAREDGFAILSCVHEIIAKYNIYNKSWNGFNIMHNHASAVGALDLGLYDPSGNGTQEILNKTQSSSVKMLYLLGADEINMKEIGKDCFVIYQGHHGDAGATRADVILPEAAYTEQDGIFVNLEGRAQYAHKAVNPPGQAKESWWIIEQIARSLGLSIAPNLEKLREMIAAEHSLFGKIGRVSQADFITFKAKGKIIDSAALMPDYNYYMSDVISRNSTVMAQCSKILRSNR